MCSVFSPTLSARVERDRRRELALTYGSIAFAAATSRSSLRSVASVRGGLPFT